VAVTMKNTLTKREAVQSRIIVKTSETSEYFNQTWFNNPEDSILLSPLRTSVCYIYCKS